MAETVVESDRLSRKYGIKGLPGLFLLGSVKFPASFPFDFMHLIFENLVPNLIRHYTGDFKGLGAVVLMTFSTKSGDILPLLNKFTPGLLKAKYR